ncbi:MAG: CotH kinase family protein [Spirochaetales bacterium]|nr:CotH kinase family protein [Spirochaetales bacterium]
MFNDKSTGSSRLPILHILCVIFTFLILILFNSCNRVDFKDLVISEVVVNSDTQDFLNGNDWVEFQNTGKSPFPLAKLSIKDSRSEAIKLPDVILNPGEYYVLQAADPETAMGLPFLPFKLGKEDSLTLSSGTEDFDSLRWKPEEVKKGSSFGRLHDHTVASYNQTPTTIRNTHILYPTPGYANVPFILFSEEQVYTVKIEMKERDLMDLLRRPVAERWYPADLEFNGARISTIGIRTKGSSSLRKVAELPGDNRSFGRYSFKLKFGKYKNQKFMGLKRLVLNNGYGDPTLMRDAIAYRIMREAGLPASRHSYVDLWLAGRHLGLYQAIEPIDSEYVERYFPGDKKSGSIGDLYKAFCSLEWKPGQTLKDYTTGRFPQLELKTNRKTIGTEHEGKAVMAFLKSINSGSAELIDTDNLTRYIAAMTLISNYDSYFANLGNYYLYEHRSVNGFAMLPWDFNLGLGRSIKEGKKCEDPVVLIDHPTIKPLSQRPIIARVLERPELREKYHGHLRNLLDTIFNPEDMRAYVQSRRDLIDPYVKEDPTGFYSFESWKKSFTEIVEDGTDSFGRAGALLPFIDARYKNVRQQLEGEIPSGDVGNGPCP